MQTKFYRKPKGAKDIKGFEGCYCIGKGGAIYSYPIPANRRYFFLRKPQTHKQGYLSIMLSKMENGKRVQRGYLIHRLVALAFLPPSRKTQVNHINGIRTDNRVENLEWVTPSENTRKAVFAGQRGYPAKITEEIREEIYKTYPYGKNDEISKRIKLDLSSKFNITYETLRKVAYTSPNYINARKKKERILVLSRRSQLYIPFEAKVDTGVLATGKVKLIWDEVTKRIYIEPYIENLEDKEQDRFLFA